MPCLQASHLASTAWQQFLYFSQPPKDGFFLQYSSSLMPSAQERHLILFALQQLYFSQPCTGPKKVDGAFLQNSSSLMPCLQASHLASTAWQQFLYFSQPPKDGFFLQYSSSLMPSAQERHLALFALQQLYFSQPEVDGFFSQYSFSLKPCLQDSHLASIAWQQLLYFSQPSIVFPSGCLVLQNSSTLMPKSQEMHLALKSPRPPSS